MKGVPLKQRREIRRKNAQERDVRWRAPRKEYDYGEDTGRLTTKQWIDKEQDNDES